MSRRNIDFCRRLKRLRKKKGALPSVVSECCGLSPGTVRRYERGERTPMPDALAAMADYFEISMDELWRGKK